METDQIWDYILVISDKGNGPCVLVYHSDITNINLHIPVCSLEFPLAEGFASPMPIFDYEYG